MKKIFIALGAIGLFLSSCTSTDQYKLTGTVNGMTEGMVYLSKLQDNKLVKTDSTQMSATGFSFEGTVPSADLVYVELEGQRGAIQLYLENSEITIDADVKNLREAKVVGSANQDVFVAFGELQKEYQDKQQALYPDYQKAAEAKDKLAMDSIEAEFNKLEDLKFEASKEFVKTNRELVVSAFVAYRISSSLEASGMEEVYSLLSEEVKLSSFAVLIKDKIEVLKKIAVGQPAPDFTLNTAEGVAVTLSSLKGKVVVIDFWASWCGPCRKENPHMIELYKELNPKGVEFLGVSVDQDKAKWKEAVEKDGLLWSQLVDDAETKAADKYAVQAIPFTVVIDKNGNIAAKKVFGDELKAVIEKMI